MRKSFTRLFGFLLLNVMMLFSFGLYAQVFEQQSTVELKAATVDKCYNATNSYTAAISTKDFLLIKSFDVTLKYDQTEFGVTTVTNFNSLLGGTVTTTVDPVAGKINVKWSNTTAVTIGNVGFYASLFDVKFNVLNFPNNSGDDLFDSSLAWDVAASKFWYASDMGATPQSKVETTNFTNGLLNVPVSYTAIQYTVTPATCSGGQAIINITSPVGAGLYYYFNGSTTSSTTPVATANAPSNNTVRIMDASGCYSHEFSIPVTAPTPLVINSVTTENAKCYGANGEIQVDAAGGTGPYTYYVVPDTEMTTFQAQLMYNNGKYAAELDKYRYTNFQILKPAGIYWVNVDGANGCNNMRQSGYYGLPYANPAWQSVTITQPAAITLANPAVTNILCNGSATGSIMVDGTTILGGSATYTVSINNINWFVVGTTTTPTYTFTGLTAGTRTVTVMDSNGCSTIKVATVTQPVAMAFALAYQDATCAGGATGSVTVSNITGGTAPYTLEVQQFGTATWTTSAAGAGPLTVTGLAANYYRVQVKDFNGCVKTFSNQDGSGNVLPIQAPGQLAFTTNTVAGVEVACNGGSFTLTITATGGVAPYLYSFDGGTTSSTSASKMFSGLVTDTTVSLQVTDKNSCPKNLDVTINVPTVLTADLNMLASGPVYFFPPTCPGGNDGRVSVLAQGGSAPYMYSTDNVIWYANPVLAVPEGTTTVTVKDAKGCTAVKSVFVPSLTASTLTATVTSIDCHGAKTGEINVVTTWQASRTVKYYVSATQSTVFTTGTSFNPTLINTVANTNTKTTFVAGTYYLGARDEFGCMSNVVKVDIIEKAALAMTAAVTNATCSGLFDGTLTINTTGGFGQPMYAYANNAEALSSSTLLFSPIGTWSATTSIGKQIVQVQRGTYYVKLTDGCSGNTLTAGPFIVEGYKPITFTGTVGKTDITCNGANNGTITVPLAGVKGGKPEFDTTGDYIFTLIKPVGTVTNTTGAFAGLAGGTYTITIKDASNCSSVSTIPNITIVNPSAVALSVTGVTHFTCKDSRDGRIAVSATGGTAGYWLAVNAVTPGTAITASNPNWIAFGTASTTTTKTYIATEPGVYYLYVKDANGCIGNTVSVTVLEPAVLAPAAAVTNATCNGANGSVVLTTTGGWGATFSPTDYVYTVGTATSTSSFTLAAGTYTATVKVNSGGSMVNGIYTYPQVTCSYSVPFTITQPVPYSYTAFTAPVKCKGDANGSLTVTVLGGSVASVTTTGNEYYVQLTTTAAPTLVNGSAWKLTTNKMYKFDTLSSAHYTVWISNKNDGTGCLIPAGTETPTNGVFTKANSWQVLEPELALTASVTFDNNVVCYGGNTGKFHVTATGGNGGYKYAAKISQLPAHLLLASELVASDWQDSNVFDHATVGTWIIWVKDVNDCIVGGEGNGTPVDEWRVQIVQPNEVAFSRAITQEVTCYGTATGKLQVTPTTSAGQPFTWSLTGTSINGVAVNLTGTYTGTTNFIISNIPANKTFGATATTTYTVTLTDKNGCSKSYVAPIFEQKTLLTVDIVKADGAFLCPGDNNGTIEAIATGGASPYSYRLWRDGVAYTAWVNLPSFLVQVGHTWAVEVKDANDCLATDQEIINAPVGVTAILKETTCYSDAKASVLIKATGDAGRTFSVRYRLNTATYPTTWTPINANGELRISDLIFSNVNVTQNFYYFQIKDDKGCITELVDKSFVPTQHPLQVTTVVADLSASMTITGGISPYSYQIGTSTSTVTLPTAGDTFMVVNLPAGQNTITVSDAHGCTFPVAVSVAPVTVVAVPASGANQLNTFTVALTFNRDVTGVASSTTVTGGTGTPTVTGSGKVYTVSVAGADMATVTLALGSGIMDAAGNTLSATTFSYTIGDHVSPTVTITDPAAPVAKVFTVGLTFSEAVSGVTVGTGVTVAGGTASVTGSGSTYSLTVTAPEQTEVTIVLTDLIKDLSANANKLVAKTVKYTTGDFTAPTATFSPNGTTTPTTNNYPALVMTFNENIMVGTAGSVKIVKKSDGVTTVTVPVSGVTVSGKTATITYAGGLDKNTEYYVLVDGTAVKDLAGNAFAGVTATTTWTFKTGPVFATPNDPIFNSLEFKVYPNPFVDYVTVTNASELSKVVVSNIAGQVVKEVVNPSNTIQLDQLVSGVYFISLYEGNTVIKTVKIVKR